MSIHTEIKRLRTAKGWSQQRLADEVSAREGGAKKLAWQTVQQWEREHGTAPKRKRLEHVADALGTSPAELLAGAPPIVLDSSAPPEETNIPEVTITDWKPGDPLPRTTGELIVCDQQLLIDFYELLPEEQEALRSELHERAERLRRHSEIVLKKAGVKAPAPKSLGVGNAIPAAPGGIERRVAEARVATDRRVHPFTYKAPTTEQYRDHEPDEERDSKERDR